MVRDLPETDDPMRILRVAQTAYPDVKGGGAYHVHAMSRSVLGMRCLQFGIDC